MEIITESGAVYVNKSKPYGKWLAAYCATGAWTGWATLADVWANAKSIKPQGVTWAAWGRICGILTYNHIHISLAVFTARAFTHD